MGLDMRFDCHDHEEGSGTLDEHFHSDKKTHLHIIDFSYDADKLHHHDNESNEDKDDCCCDEITKFNLLDKTHTSFAQFDAIFFNAFISSFFHIDVFATSQFVTSIKHFVRNYHPPIHNIRIAIQSFQI